MTNFKTTSRGMDKPHFVPNKEALVAMLDTITTPEAAYYAQVRTAMRLGNDEISLKVVKKVADFASSVQAVANRQSTGTEWSGKGEPPSQFQSLQQFLSEQSISNIKELFKQVGLVDENGQLKGELELDFAVNDKAQFVRGYKFEGKPIHNKAMVDMLDDAFKAWLAEKGMFYKNGQLYEVDTMGKVKQNQKGEDILMSKEEIFSRVQDDKNGFTAYMKSQGVQSKVVRRAFPESESEVDRQEDVKTAIQHGQTAGIDEVGADKTAEAEQPSGPNIGG